MYLASYRYAYDSLLNKMEIISIHNDELANKLEASDSNPKHLKFEQLKFTKKDVYTSYIDFIVINSPPLQTSLC